MQLPFRRKPADPDESAVQQTAAQIDGSVTTVAKPNPRAYTPSKRELGRITPKRKAGGRVVEPPPTSRREATKRMRQKQREQRAESRAGMLAGKEEFLPPRDKGPERALVRDIVDSRRNLASYFIVVMMFVIVASLLQIVQLVAYATIFMYVYAFAVVVDSMLLTRRVRLMMKQRFPKSAQRNGSYAVMRSLSFRRLRMPAPRVKLGAKI